MKKAVIFGGSGGIGSKLVDYLKLNYEVTSLSSKDVSLSNSSDVRDFFRMTSYDIVINMAGYNYDSFLHKLADNTEVCKQIMINSIGSVTILENCLPQMRERGYGRVILNSSVLVNKTVLGTSIYTASKAFVEALVRVAAAENAAKGITINAIRMGYMDAGMTYKIDPTVQETILKQIPAKKFGEVSQLSNLIEFLINNDYVNGTTLEIDGAL